MNNPYYTSYIASERHAIVDATVAASLEALRVPKVAQYLGEYAVDLHTILQQVTVPNVHHNKVRFDCRCEEKTAIVAVHPNEVVYFNPWEVPIHARQQRSLEAGFNAESSRGLLEYYAAHNQDEHSPLRLDSLVESGVAAHVSTYGIAIETNIGDVTVRAAPLMVIDANRPQRRMSTVVLHELTHVLQAYDYPVMMPDQNPERLYIEEELEAYYVEAQIIRAYRDAGRYNELVAFTRGEAMLRDVEFVDDVRRRHQTNSDQVFEANDNVVRALHDNNINL